MNRPLEGRTILVTRAREQAQALGDALAQAGAQVLYCAAIRISDPQDPAPFRAAVARLPDFDWVVLTSVNGVARFFEEVGRAGVDARALHALYFAAVGPATAAAIEAHGVSVRVVPDEYEGAALAAAMRGHLKPGAGVLLARAAGANAELPQGLRAAGARVVDVESYRSVPDLAEIERVRAALDAGDIDLFTFTSPSAVSYFMQIIQRRVDRIPVAAIGPITASRARDEGLRVEVEASEYSIPGLVAAIISYFGGHRGFSY